MIAFVASGLLSRSFLGLLRLALSFLGLGYVIASVLAWTGFGNLYRYSPTLLAGSRSYRQMVARGPIAKEGRDPQSLWIGILFGIALLGTAFALSDAVSAAITIAVAVIAVSAYFRLTPVRGPQPPNP
ncbi:MAG TPA: hypothetical protein VNO76_08760 [Thermoplasmata archaeon]|nr:hypothetical protein [Thermoplasmata archaeon]